MRISEFLAEISRRNFLKGTVAGAGIATVAYNTLKNKEEPVDQVQQSPEVEIEFNSPAEKYLHDYAISQGITGIELAALLSQCSHESAGFTKFIEDGPTNAENPQAYFRDYDISFNRSKAIRLGNTEAGDGYQYRGRGYIHLTGRSNYRIFGKKIGQPLEENPDLAADQKIAAQIAVVYWKARVAPQVTDFNDVESVTKPINSGLKGLIDRTQRFKEYMKSLG